MFVTAVKLSTVGCRSFLSLVHAYGTIYLRIYLAFSVYTLATISLWCTYFVVPNPSSLL